MSVVRVLTVVRIKRVNFSENIRTFRRANETVRCIRLSVERGFIVTGKIRWSYTQVVLN